MHQLPSHSTLQPGSLRNSGTLTVGIDVSTDIGAQARRGMSFLKAEFTDSRFNPWLTIGVLCHISFKSLN